MLYDRAWFLTWHTYGTWLPGDKRGFVSPVRMDSGQSELHNVPRTSTDCDHPQLSHWARARLKSDPIVFSKLQADVLAAQLQQTAVYRGWSLLAFAIVTNHVHVVLGVAGDPNPSDLIGDLKSYGSRALNQRFERPQAGTWWTESGSKRKLDSEQSILGAIRYTIEQQGALVVWCAPIPELDLAGGYLLK